MPGITEEVIKEPLKYQVKTGLREIAGSGTIPKGTAFDWAYPSSVMRRLRAASNGTQSTQVTKVEINTPAASRSKVNTTKLTGKKAAEYKHTKVNVTGDMRNYNAGRPRASRFSTMEEMVYKYKEHAKRMDDLKKRMAKTNNPTRLTELKKQYRDYVKEAARKLGY